MTPEFLGLAFLVVASPGTGVLYTLSEGLTRGARSSLIAAFGCTLGIVPHLLAAITGLAALLHASAVAFATLKYLGVAYLLYMAWMTVRDRSALSVETSAPTRSAGRIIVRGILLNLLNPKLTLFFFAFLPQFVDGGGPGALATMLELSATFMAMTFAVFALYGIFAAAVRRHVLARPAILAGLRYSFAAAFAALGARLALAR
ncbi:LysE family translocator [Oryzibacter oryziterrae]|uniref:LysE family translocator n=1 Tax=Oryzibacter oryziterrae TaxID=2766474 RepID=UPI001F4730C2|nr:LysE family translocator [Oryzibacter oryziterrae]